MMTQNLFYIILLFIKQVVLGGPHASKATVSTIMRKKASGKIGGSSAMACWNKTVDGVSPGIEFTSMTISSAVSTCKKASILAKPESPKDEAKSSNLIWAVLMQASEITSVGGGVKLIPVPPWNFSSKVRMLPYSLIVIDGSRALIWPSFPTSPTVTSIHLDSPLSLSSSLLDSPPSSSWCASFLQIWTSAVSTKGSTMKGQNAFSGKGIWL
mmetsp:Transcript_257/g.626  ORF Transcript_257/g.626 Transcript_257/m.626 type:complete len:212 (+) Transcript_257:23-658(+)